MHHDVRAFRGFKAFLYYRKDYSRLLPPWGRTLSGRDEKYKVLHVECHFCGIVVRAQHGKGVVLSFLEIDLIILFVP